MKHQKKRITTYFKERELKGKTQAEAEKEAYGKVVNHGSRIENTKQFDKLRKRYKDVLEEKTSFSELADIQLRNARQKKDKGASNKAVESVIERMEPSEGVVDTGEVKIIFKK